jgi:hypothetical protein
MLVGSDTSCLDDGDNCVHEVVTACLFCCTLKIYGRMTVNNICCYNVLITFGLILACY